MSTATPFQTTDKKGKKSPWLAVVKGKGLLEVGPPDGTLEEAQKKADEIAASVPIPSEPMKKQTTESMPSIGLTDSSTQTSKPPKPQPGEVRKNGLSEISPERLKVLREKIAGALSAGNVSLDRALVSIFRDNVPILNPESYTLLAAGWELACEQYFVSGIVPPWLLIVLGNVQVCSAMFELSKPKPREEPKEDAAAKTDAGAKAKQK